VAALVELKPVDSVDVFVLVDNYVDVLMAGGGAATRYRPPYDGLEREGLRAEHGSAFLVSVTAGGSTASLLYDAGLGRDTVAHNLDVLAAPIPDLRAIVLSHGHTDHHGGLEGLIRRVGARGMPLVLHPDAWKDREVRFPTGEAVRLPPPTRNDLEREGVDVIEEVEPTLLIDGTVLVSGQVERHTEFEHGMPTQFARGAAGEWQPDPWVWDDQCLVFNVRDRGLVVVSGCSHAGIVNILRHVRRLTGVDRVHGLVGGLHLTSADMWPAIGPTLDELEALRPEVVVPGHCTGWRATHELARRLPDAFTATSVGTRLRF
jgi:7,8-dihydropterin-6-yl-methyl-4-(beta-D-ribofuranosyl)aminobenzene 5'-phosphate synthase